MLKKYLNLSLGWLTVMIALVASSGASAAVILQYHHIDNTTPFSTSTRPELFANHLKWLKENNFRVIALPELAEKIRKKQPLPDNSAVITFDDAWVSIHSNALPLLKKYDYPFTVFVNTGAVDKRQHMTMSWNQLRELTDYKGTLANHTVDHAHLIEKKPGETPAAWVKRIQADILQAEARVENETGQNLKLLAWPFGETAPELEAMILKEGFLGFGQQSGAIGDHMNLAKIPRFPMGAGYGAMKNFPTKVKSLPLPVVSVEPVSNIAPLDGNTGPVKLILKKGQWRSSQLACYALGSVLPVTWLDKGKTQLQITLPPLPLGRSRVNCTAPGPDGRWFWFSKDWVRLNKDGTALD